ncbi:MAG: cytochrome c biogenesis protein CcsA [Bacteriovoracaceae bacterium]|nr:cytochrome c biogenesis protein CcsA [Bacteriovoracaceae bacterium]
MLVAFKILPALGFFLSLSAVLFGLFKKDKIVVILSVLTAIVLAVDLGLLWVLLERPPMRTLGETRLWYAFFLPVLGLIVNRKVEGIWILLYTSFMTGLFLVLNLVSPENFDKTLMPALQSVWFVPHVIVYILSYALLGMSSLFSFWAMYKNFRGEDTYAKTLKIVHPYVLMGIVLLTLGLLFGALWAKEAWGHYWTWDPKETWAFITWLSYLNYLHATTKKHHRPKTAIIFLAVNFIVIMLCWFGVNYMPSAQTSVHTYTN